MTPNFPRTVTGRPVHSAAFERAVALFGDERSDELTDEHRDKLLESIITQIAAGTTDIGVLAHNAVRDAANADA